MFCGCSTDFQDAPPNSHTCPVCLAMPGVLPVINRLAVRHVLATGIAIGADHARGHPLGPQELLLPGPAQGLPDQPVRPAARVGRQPHLRDQRGSGDHHHHPRPPRGGHRAPDPPGRRGGSTGQPGRLQPLGHGAHGDRHRPRGQDRGAGAPVRRGAAAAAGDHRRVGRGHGERPDAGGGERVAATGRARRRSGPASRSRT